MKWWLVSDDDLNTARKMLEAAIERVEEGCATAMCSCDTFESGAHSQIYKDALHALETGMHKTEAVPADFATDPSPAPDSRERARAIGDDVGNEKGE